MDYGQQALWGGGSKGKRMIRRKKKRKMSWAKRRTRDKNRMIRELDDECRQRIMERDREVCQLNLASTCTPQANLQWCHFQTRGILCVRWDEANSFAACQACHKYWHTHMGQALLVFQTRWPERWEHVKRILSNNVEFGYEQVRLLHEQTFGQAGAR